MTTPIDPNDKILWDNYVRAWESYRNHRWQLTQQALNLTQAIEHGLAERYKLPALELVQTLNLEDRKFWFGKILVYSSWQNPYYLMCQELVLSFPKEWLLENIEEYAKPILSGKGAAQAYDCLLRLFEQIDKSLATRLAHRAIQHEDEDVRELGEWWLKEFNR